MTTKSGFISTTIGLNSPFLAVDQQDSKSMIAIKAALNGNIFMHCPVDMAEDFQVGGPSFVSVFLFLVDTAELRSCGATWHEMAQVVLKRCRVRRPVGL